MTKIKQLFPLIVLMVMVILFCGAFFAGAVDELRLSGYIREVNTFNKTVVVDVRSEGCEGVKTFLVSDRAVIAQIEENVGSRMTFSINSSICREGAIYALSSMIIDRKRSMGK
jgi:hypothetical protein